jgi:tetratricopeptide (TPR) repeat protein
MAQNVKNKAEQNENEVDVAISKTEAFIENNKKRILWGAIVAVAIVLVVSVWNWFNTSRDTKAQDEIYTAQFLFEAGKYDEALTEFEAVIDSYGSTKTGNLAKAYAGLCQKELKNYDEAISYLKQFSGDDMIIAPAIEAALGDCYVETDQLKEAVKCFEKAAAATNNEAYSPLYLKKAGLAYEALGDKEGALKAYTAIKDNWLSTSIGQDIEKYIYRVQH